MSCSAGVFDDGHISAHLYYWLDTPIANDVLRQWARGCDRRLVDPAVFNAVQPHYTAAPLFGEGCVDPFPNSRSGLIKKGNAVVCLEVRQLAAESKQARETSENKLDLSDAVRGFSNILATLGDHDGGSGFNEPLLRAVASYVSKVGLSRIYVNLYSLVNCSNKYKKHGESILEKLSVRRVTDYSHRIFLDNAVKCRCAGLYSGGSITRTVTARFPPASRGGMPRAIGRSFRRGTPSVFRRHSSPV